jgi:hypothetical protein
MIAAQVRARIEAPPFREFDLCLADGRAIQVAHPDQLGFSGGNRVVSVSTPDGIVEVIDLMLVLSLRFHEPDFVHSAPNDESQ